MFKKMIFPLLLVSQLGLTGCASLHSHDHQDEGYAMMEMASPAASPMMMRSKAAPGHINQPMADEQAERKLIKRSWLTVKVTDLSAAEQQAKQVVEKHQGYIQNTHGEQDKSFNLSIRVPQNAYSNALAELRSIGELASENESVEDVTTEFIDNQARLENLYKLRERIQNLLSRADRVEEILKIERELNRIQSEIDRLEGRMKYLNSQVDYASIDFNAEKQTTYGPLGYFFMGIWWGVEKLFVWDS